MSTLMAFDTSYLYFRAFFGVPSTFRALDGRPVNAVRGTLDFISRLVGQYLSLIHISEPTRPY